MKIGDKVRFLNEVGGGKVTGFQGKDIVLVEDADGFDIPMPVRECAKRLPLQDKRPRFPSPRYQSTASPK